MKFGKKSVRVLAALSLAAAVMGTGCAKDKGTENEDNRQEAAGQQETADLQETAGPAEEGTDEGAVDAPGMPESVMAEVCGANGIVALADGSLLVTDIYAKVIWQVQPQNGISIVYAGGETVTDLYGQPVGGYNDASLEESFFKTPWAIAPFLEGWAVSDAENGAVRLITKDKVQTVNGSTQEKLTVSDLGVVFERPTGLAADSEGSLYVSDTLAGAVRKITKDGKVTTVADGLEGPMGLCWKDGALYAAESEANRIIRIADGKIETVAGCGENDYIDGTAEEAAFAFPQGVAVGDDGAVYVADTGNSAVRQVKDGEVTTILSRDRTSLAISPVSPSGLLIQGKELYVCDSFARKVLRITVD